MNNQISKNISYQEAIRSNTATRYGIKNIPSEEHIKYMKVLAEKVFEPLREYFKQPLLISSFFRSIALNKKIGGSSISQHCLGQAMDIDATGYSSNISNTQIFHYIKDKLDFDQLIAEFPDVSGEPKWIHVSYVEGKNKRQILVALKDKKKTFYVPYNKAIHKHI